MRYALLFYHPPPTAIPEAERESTIGAMLAEMGAWQKELERAGVFRMTMGLPVDAATTLRPSDREVLVTDGLHAVTKEILGGLAVIECDDLDEALAWAKRCPLLRIGAIEVRPGREG
jgi:hypothetical protein